MKLQPVSISTTLCVYEIEKSNAVDFSKAVFWNRVKHTPGFDEIRFQSLITDAFRIGNLHYHSRRRINRVTYNQVPVVIVLD